jgi:3-isopropylmalate/(R)-2-methylmalate dehydratase large subunit
MTAGVAMRGAQARTMVEKIMARACGLPDCRTGDMVQPEPDRVIVHDGYVESLQRELAALGYRRITRPERMAFVTDHDVIYSTARHAERGQANRRIAREWRIGHFSDAGQEGHGHLFPMETGLVRPGTFVFAYDPHCTNFGAIGTLAVGVVGDISVVAATGTLAMPVPPSVRVRLAGAFRPGVHPRDLGFALSQALTSGAAGVGYDARVFEFTGPAVQAMPVAARVALCNTLTEIGALSVLFPPMTHDNQPVAALAALVGDEDAGYEGTIDWDLGQVQPQVALPGAPEQAVALQGVADRPIDHAYIGSCGSGMYEDFRDAAAFLRGKVLAEGVRMVVVPGTTRVARRLMDEGLLQVFLDAGATVLPPGCGPCAGGRTGMLGPGEVSISTAATNSTGRMGSRESLAYLASPLTVAASAVAGRINDPQGR